MRRSPPLLMAFLGLFVAAMAYLVATSLIPREVPTFSPATAETAVNGGGDAHAMDTITIDAGDPERWWFLRLGARKARASADSTEWDVAARRYNLRARGPVADLGPLVFDEVRELPATTFVEPDGRGDAGHPAMRRWYRYGMLTHLLESRGHVYVMPADDGGYLKLQVLSYYCPGPRPGCLTIRWARLPAPH